MARPEPKQIFLHNHQGTSDKVYNVYLRPVTLTDGTISNLFEVYAEWGRRNGALKGMLKCAQATYGTADWVLTDLVRKKKDRGYVEYEAPVVHWELTAAPEEDYLE